VKIPSTLSTTGESPLYDLRPIWKQSRHIATLDVTSARNSDSPVPRNCRTSRLTEDPVELTEYATFKEIHFLFGQRLWKCIAYSRREPLRNRLPALVPQNVSLLRGMIIRSCRILVCNPLKPGWTVPMPLQFDVCEAIRAQTERLSPPQPDIYPE
jgi:hypothetical protein